MINHVARKMVEVGFDCRLIDFKLHSLLSSCLCMGHKCHMNTSRGQSTTSGFLPFSVWALELAGPSVVGFSDRRLHLLSYLIGLVS